MEDIIGLLARRKESETLPESAFTTIEPKEGTILFVDGGNAELVKAPDFSLNFIRTAGIIFKGKNKIKMQICEFYALFYAERKGEKIIVNSKIVPIKGFCPNEKELSFALMPGEISSFADIARRIAEINLACAMANNIESGSIIALDGNLEAKTEIERAAIEKLRRIAMEKNLGLCAISKTTSMVGYNGESVSFIVAKSAPNERCFVQLAESEPIKTFFLKLHPKSDYIFRCDLFPETGSWIFGQLAFVSNDAVFIGYPYGFVEADMAARISNREKEILRTELMAKAGKKWLEIEQMEKSLNAHGILDSIF